MAPKELIGRYKRYKHGTRNIIYWLTQAAASCCDLKDAVKSLGQNLPSRQGRKQAGAQEYEVRSHELEKLAQIISEAQPRIEVPEGLLSLLDDVIAGREECAEWYSTQALEKGSKVEKENDGHREFIEVLARVCDTLKAARPTMAPKETGPHQSSKAQSKNSKLDKKDHDDLASIFDGLDIEEPSANPLGDAPTVKITDTTGGSTDCRFKLEKEDDDAAFAIWCFLQDLSDVRHHVNQVWKDYKAGQLSLTVAALLVDTAFGLLRRMDDDFASPIQSTEWRKLLTYLGLDMFTFKQGVWLRPDPNRLSAKPRLPDSKVNIVELLCPVAFLCLEHYLMGSKKFRKDTQQLLQGRGSGFKEDPLPEYAPDFQQTLYKLILELEMIALPRPFPGVFKFTDEFVQGLLRLRSTGEIHMWLVAACQIYLDIYDLLGIHTSYGVPALQDCSAAIQQMAMDAAAFTPKMSMPEYLSAFSAHVSKASYRRFDQPQSPDAADRTQPQSNMEGSLPVYAGNLLADMQLIMYDFGIYAANHGSTILAAAHLYKSLRAQGSLKTDWQDMNHLLSAFGKNQPLVTPIDKQYDGGQAERRFLLSLGCDMQEVSAATKLQSASVKAKKPPRTISVTSPLLHALLGRMSDGKTYYKGANRTDILGAVLEGLTADDDNAKRNKRAGAASKTFTPVQLLETMRQSLVHEEPRIHFDFIGFTRSCARLLQHLASEFDWALPKGDFPDPFHHSFVGTVLYHAGLNNGTQEIAAAFQAHIEEEGKTFVKKAYDQSSGRIPKDLRPRFDSENGLDEVYKEMMRFLLGDDNTKLAFTGRTMAAYHQDVEPIDEDPCTDPKCAIHGDFADPTLNDDRTALLKCGSQFPKGVAPGALYQISSHPMQMRYIYFKATYNLVLHHKSRNITDAMIRRISMSLTGMDLVKTAPDADGLEWSYVMAPGHELYNGLFAHATRDYSVEDTENMKGTRFYLPVWKPEGVDQMIPKKGKYLWREPASILPARVGEGTLPTSLAGGP